MTANTRLARDLRATFDAQQIQAGRTLWPSPDILPRDAWLRRTWDALLLRDPNDRPILLTPDQELALWERIIGGTGSPSGPSANILLDRSSTASTAAAAWDLLHLYAPQVAGGETDALAIASSATADSEAFSQWRRQFERALAQNGWITLAQLPTELRRASQQGHFTPRAPLSFAGFDDWNAADRLLVEELQRHVPVQQFSPPVADANPQRFRMAFPSVDEELRHAATWAQAQLLQDPQVHIGVIVRGLSTLTAAVDRIFRETLHPDAGFVRSSATLFHISAGDRSSHVPLISTAVQLLRLAAHGLDPGEAAMLFRSPFTLLTPGDGATLDRELRHKHADWVTLGMPAVRGRFHAAHAAIQNEPTRQSPSQWSVTFARMLKAAGWPGPRSLSSEEFQASEHWNQLLDRFAGLDLVSPALDLEHACRQLRQIAERNRFAPRDAGPHGGPAPVQIMDILEAAGASFDAVWIAGLRADQWPAPARPHPFLPISFQRAANMPHSSPERELEFAQAVTTRLLASSRRVICSWPMHSQEEELRVSPLIDHLPEPSGQDSLSAVPQRIPSPAERAFSDAMALEQLPLGSATPVPAGTLQAGGVRVLEDQAACAFRAFAMHRLQIREWEESELGISPREHGSAIHKALELVWQALGDQHTLHATPTNELRYLIQTSVQVALEQQMRHRTDPASERFRLLEQERLAGLIEEWMEEEKRRHPFEILQTESKQTVEIGGLQLSVKVDRIDRYADGTHAVIDYKTSKLLSPTQWEGDRPDSPQVPLYTVKSTVNVNEAAFAQIAASSIKLISRKGGDFTALREHWARALEALAQEFRAGRADVDPKNLRKTCQYCRLKSLCRIAEVNPQGGLSEEDGDAHE